jgi:hypothetical protein
MIEEYFQYNEWLAFINGTTFTTALVALVGLGCCALVLGEQAFYHFVYFLFFTCCVLLLLDTEPALSMQQTLIAQ